MILSRVRPLTRMTGSVVHNLLRGNNGNNFKQATRNKTWVLYRNPVLPEDYLNAYRKQAVFFSAVLWWWILWRLVSEYHNLVGPDLPKMSDFTDEELGIPPLDEEDP